MKITNTGPGSVDRSGGAGGVAPAKGEKRSPGRAEQAQSDISEKVAISGRARDISKAREAASSAPDVNDAKIAKLKAAIQNGTYKVDAEKVADRLVDEHLSTAF